MVIQLSPVNMQKKKKNHLKIKIYTGPYLFFLQKHNVDWGESLFFLLSKSISKVSFISALLENTGLKCIGTLFNKEIKIKTTPTISGF
jgi:hypothetical protein